jgi:hypothetical protein
LRRKSKHFPSAVEMSVSPLRDDLHFAL